MRRSLLLLVAAAFLVPLMTACEGPVGPEGPAGIQGTEGPQGPAGPAGPAGQNAAETCTQCHTNNTNLFAKQVQYEKSTHRLGGNFERATSPCALCHTHQGFLERMATGSTTLAASFVPDPAPINCRTCHKIHQTFTAADYALTTTAPNGLIFNQGHGPVDLGPIGNLCSQCHQANTLSPKPVPGGAPLTVTSSRYGFHHGPQAQILAGTGLFVLGSGVITGPGAHGNKAVNADACGTCHMGQAFGEQAGGHTWKMAYEYHEADVQNVVGCKGCHQTLTKFDYNGVQTEIQGLIDELAAELTRIGVRRTDNYFKTGTWPADVVAAFANWQAIWEDRSVGVHNPTYVETILRASITKMKTY